MKASELMQGLQIAIERYGDLEILEWNEDYFMYVTPSFLERIERVNNSAYIYIDWIEKGEE